MALTKSLGKELAEKNICVNCVTPAVIETDILKQCTQQHFDSMRSKIPMSRFGKVDEAAALVGWLCDLLIRHAASKLSRACPQSLEP